MHHKENNNFTDKNPQANPSIKVSCEKLQTSKDKICKFCLLVNSPRLRFASVRCLERMDKHIPQMVVKNGDYPLVN